MKPSDSNVSDEDLVRLLLDGGDSTYYKEIYNRYFKKVYYQCLSYVKHTEIAEDLAQDIFLKLYDRLSKFNFRSSFSTWIFSVSRNMCLDYLKKGSRTHFLSDNEIELPEVPEVEDNILLAMRIDQLEQVLDLLTPDEKSILIMMYAYEWQMDEIAETLGVTLSAIKMRLKRAKFKVIQLHKEKFEDQNTGKT